MQFIPPPSILENTFNRRKQIASNWQRAEVAFTFLAPSDYKMRKEKTSINSTASSQRMELLGRSFRNVITLIRLRTLTGRGTITNTDLGISRKTFGLEMTSFTSRYLNPLTCQLKRFRFIEIPSFFSFSLSLPSSQINSWPKHGSSHRFRGF